MLDGMAGSTLGVWVAHGEGRFHCPDRKIFRKILKKDLAPIRFVNDDMIETETYPFNPNGSPEGITALCSEDGRHLAMMPHPERCFQLWQLPYMPEEWQMLQSAPWLKMFQNAYDWCVEQK
jgi:phosphoribosylformylglycinamidine synthase